MLWISSQREPFAFSDLGGTLGTRIKKKSVQINRPEVHVHTHTHTWSSLQVSCDSYNGLMGGRASDEQLSGKNEHTSNRSGIWSSRQVSSANLEESVWMVSKCANVDGESICCGSGLDLVCEREACLAAGGSGWKFKGRGRDVPTALTRVCACASHLDTRRGAGPRHLDTI